MLRVELFKKLLCALIFQKIFLISFPPRLSSLLRFVSFGITFFYRWLLSHDPFRYEFSILLHLHLLNPRAESILALLQLYKDILLFIMPILLQEVLEFFRLQHLSLKFILNSLWLVRLASLLLKERDRRLKFRAFLFYNCVLKLVVVAPKILFKEMFLLLMSVLQLSLSW